MHLRLSLLTLCLCLTSALDAAQPAASANDERIHVSFMLARGRAPSPAEAQAWTQPGPSSVSEMLARHQQQLQTDETARRAVAKQAAADAFGLAEASVSVQGAYFEQMRQHVRSLADHPADYEKVIQRAYQRVLRRPAYEVELEYWRARDALPFVLLVGCVENWAVRNAPGLMATTGIPTLSLNSSYLSTVRLSPTVAAEARLAADLAFAQHADLAAATGRTVVAAGAGSVVSLGHIHLAVAGAADLVLPPDRR